MDKILNDITKYGIINKGDRIAVACSGGKDSMALLHYLSTKKDEIGFELSAVNVDHCIRDVSAEDSKFVAGYCQKNNIKLIIIPYYKLEEIKIEDLLWADLINAFPWLDKSELTHELVIDIFDII